ncbi:MAG TPA: hypothetical protein VI934_05070 [Candidatus Nanoarchaeia archaeon]|nr:hypothetical protein [Candidatus Nanoarchaeia archaeon]
MKYDLQGVSQSLVEVNRRFGSGTVLNKGSLDFALNAAFRGKDWEEQLAFVVRALLCDHVFEDGNKRTAVAYIMAVFEGFRLRYDPFMVDRLVLKIAKNSISDVRKIRRMIQNAYAKNI